MATDVARALSEAEVASAGSPKRVYYWTNQDALTIGPKKHWGAVGQDGLNGEKNHFFWVSGNDIVENVTTLRAEPMNPECTIVVRDYGRDSEVRMPDRRNQYACLLYTSPSPRDRQKSRMPSSA